jgi:hypothetical protein
MFFKAIKNQPLTKKLRPSTPIEGPAVLASPELPQIKTRQVNDNK